MPSTSQLLNTVDSVGNASHADPSTRAFPDDDISPSDLPPAYSQRERSQDLPVDSSEAPSYESHTFVGQRVLPATGTPTNQTLVSLSQEEASGFKNFWSNLFSRLKGSTPNTERAPQVDKWKSKIDKADTEINLFKDLRTAMRRQRRLDDALRGYIRGSEERCTIEKGQLEQRMEIAEQMDVVYRKLNSLHEVEFGSEWQAEVTQRLEMLKSKVRGLCILSETEPKLEAIDRDLRRSQFKLICPKLSGMSIANAVRISDAYRRRWSCLSQQWEYATEVVALTTKCLSKRDHRMIRRALEDDDRPPR
ncbi:hypothetical protein F4777DRAFT_596717 [Nemania sp. FL0916]|nr:hypothetical protein F4777DRAFT_596717 [Nemania sp. FL0916]